MTELFGIVRSGEGSFGYWIDRLEAHYERLTGMRLFPGTLNIHLEAGPFPFPPGVPRLAAADYGGDVSVSLLPCRILGHRAFALRPDGDTGKHGDPRDAILEIATDVHLRATYGLTDGDRVGVDVQTGELPRPGA